MKRKTLDQCLEGLVEDIKADEDFRAPEPWEDDELIYFLREVQNELRRTEPCA